QETKHHFHRYARSLGHLDWANQPDPFRRYEGAPLVSLPLLREDDAPLSPSYDDLYRAGAVASVPVSLRSLSRCFEQALALTAWKQAGETRWALRSNPSSGNLHPTEGYLVVGAIESLAETPGLYHYAPKEHALERRAESSGDCFSRLMQDFPPDAFLIGLSSVHWREAWKYGERAFRYCQHDVGHAIGSIRIAAATLGWQALLLDGVSDATIERLLGLNREDDFEGAEREHPDCLMVLWPARSVGEDSSGKGRIPLCLDPEVVREQAWQVWHGKANRLSRDRPVPWELIEEAARASWKDSDDRRFVDGATGRSDGSGQHPSPIIRRAQSVRAGQIIRQRRSAVAFDGKTSISADRFFAMLERVLPCVERPVLQRPMPWDAVPWEPAIHLLLLVHRVEGLKPGLYVLVRDRSKEVLLKQTLQGQFEWKAPSGCPENLPLFLLQEGNARQVAIQLSCGQDIAGDSCFSLGMLAEFESVLREQGAWWYRRFFWEAGLVGQVLYLEAEAAGLRGTGIGCFFDDPVHQLLGLTGYAFQSLYHFTVGGAVDDARLTTLPPYGTSDA
ncbi:MAG: SagB/ThcOx family dehydrogenase, partial [Nitrospira sp.]|nr:SagB/ThcOx family dehydrogenase [Nitrospira sp.]